MTTLIGLGNYARNWLIENAESMPWLPDEDDSRRFEFFVYDLVEDLKAAIHDRCIEWREQQAKGGVSNG